MGELRFAKYACVKQQDKKDCGPACLSTIARHYGLKLPIARIREMAETDREGTNAVGMIRAAEKLGFRAKLVQGHEEALFSDFPLPAIAHVVVDGSLLHYVVIHKITQTQLVLADPDKGIVKYTPEEFQKQWTGFLLLMEPTEALLPRNETKSLIHWFLHLLMPQKRLVVSLIVASLVMVGVGIGQSFFMQVLLDDVLPRRSIAWLNLLLVAMICVTLFRTGLTALRTQLLLFVTRKFDTSLILVYYKHLSRLPMSFFDARETGEIVSRFSDASKIRDTISGTAFTVVVDFAMMVVGGIFLYRQNNLLFGITCLLIPIYTLLVLSFVSRFKKMNRIMMEQSASMVTHMVETVKGIVSLKAFRAEQQVNRKMEEKLTAFQDSVLKIGSTANVQSSLITLTQATGDLAILWVGARLVLANQMTIGELMTFLSLVSFFLVPVQNLINLQATLQSAVVAVDRLGEILDLQVEKTGLEDGKLASVSLQGDILIRELHFRHGTRAPVLKGIDMRIARGEKIALVGESGSGKTTLVKLLLRFYTPERGEIFIGHHNIAVHSLDLLRDKIAYVPQETFFFTGSIRDNVCLGLEEDVEMERIVQACKMAQIHDFIAGLPLGYNFFLEENASNLSGGQRQRLAIARALLKQPEILILDEATSNLDTFSERAISETLSGLHHITTIVIAHRLSTIRNCDRIFVMKEGQIAEKGTHQQLMTLRGTYYQLWAASMPDGESAPFVAT